MSVPTDTRLVALGDEDLQQLVDQAAAATAWS
jgi:hypothetical protein